MFALAFSAGCPNATTSEMANCLKAESANKISKVSLASMMNFYPVLDNDVFTDFPLNSIKKGDFKTDADLIAGFMYVEGYMFIPMLVSPGMDGSHLNTSSFR